MEVVSTLNLGSSQTKKTTACNFQTMNSCVMSYDFMRGQIGSHANNKVFKTTNKPGEDLTVVRKTRETLGGVFLLTPWLIGLKYPKKITSCYTFFLVPCLKRGFFIHSLPYGS